MENESEALAEIATAHPGANLQRLRQLRRNAAKERQEAKPPRAYRELFRALKDLESEVKDADGELPKPDIDQ
jgi:ribosome-associated protein